MALKPFIYEYCQRCGERDAEIRGVFIWTRIHNCTKPVPGPASYPKRFLLKDVVFIREDKDKGIADSLEG